MTTMVRSPSFCVWFASTPKARLPSGCWAMITCCFSHHGQMVTQTGGVAAGPWGLVTAVELGPIC